MRTIRNYKNIILGTLVIILAGILRFQNLSYSEFQDDEKKAIIRTLPGESTKKFLLNQRKGPMQFLVTKATLLLNGGSRDETSLRLPFTIINLSAVVVFYLLIYKLTNSTLASFFGAMLFSLQGFIVGFSRIAQYQNLNIFFSFLAIYLFYLLSMNTKRAYLLSMLGTISFCISLLSHWDAIFVVVPIITFYTKFLLKGSYEKKLKTRLTFLNIILGCLILLPFLIPYIKQQKSNQENIEYFERRVGIEYPPISDHLFIYELYNPYVSFYLIITLAVISLFTPKKSFPYWIWFIVNFVLIRFFMEKPGTHIYNYVLPALVLASLGISALSKIKKPYIFPLIWILMILSGYLYYQSYMLFIDNRYEYPWESKILVQNKYFTWETEVYTRNEILMFGFPHHRNWKEINEIISTDPDNCSYISNEGKEITQIYVNQKYGIIKDRKCYYIVNVIRPFNPRGTDAKFAETSGKSPIYEYIRNDEVLVKLYKIKNKTKSS